MEPRHEAPFLTLVDGQSRAAARANLLEWLVAMFCSGALVVQFIHMSEWGRPRDPFHAYYQHPVIQSITVLSGILAAAILLMLGIWVLRVEAPRPLFVLLMVACTGAALLPWVELGYGATMNYGAVRALQRLPYWMNNLGLAGSMVFGGYVILRVPLPWRHPAVLGVRVAAAALFIGATVFAAGALEAPWRYGPPPAVEEPF